MTESEKEGESRTDKKGIKCLVGMATVAASVGDATLTSTSTITKSTAAASSSCSQLTSTPAYAFITHSQEGLRDNRPPMIDNAGLARRRRRRTSQHDQAILEEEYRKCDRPDKARRREIANMVEMGDKEVQVSGFGVIMGKCCAWLMRIQIWFQNKRQSARRKLKPLLPHEIIPHSSQQATKSSSPPPFQMTVHSMHLYREDVRRNGTEKSREVVPSSSQESDGTSYPYFSSSQSPSQNYGYYSQGTPGDKDEGDTGEGDGADGADKLPPAAVRRMSVTHMRLQEALGSPSARAAPVASSSLPPPTNTGHPPSELSEYIHPAPSKLPPPLSEPTAKPHRTTGQTDYQPPTLTKRTSSFLRLSTSLDGHAEVVIDTEPTLPPPLPLAQPSTSISSSSDITTPRRLALPPPSSSVSRAVDTLNLNSDSFQVWEYFGSRGGSSGERDHYYLGMREQPDEAGTALSMARSRRRREELRAARRRLEYGGARREDRGLSVEGDEEQPFEERRHMAAPRTTSGLKRGISDLTGLGTTTRERLELPPLLSSSRKRTCRDIEIYDNENDDDSHELISSSQTTAPLPPHHHHSHHPHNPLFTTTVAKKKTKKLEYPNPGVPARASKSVGIGGKDFYIHGHESDKENFSSGEGSAEVKGRSGSSAVYYPEGAGSTVLLPSSSGLGIKKRGKEKEKNKRRAASVDGLGLKSGKVKISSTSTTKFNTTAKLKPKPTKTGSTTRPKRKRRVLGEVQSQASTSASSATQPGLAGTKIPPKPSETTLSLDPDLGGAELLLSLSAGRWGA